MPDVAALAMGAVWRFLPTSKLFAGFFIGVAAAFALMLFLLGGIRFVRGQLPVLEI